MRVAITGRFENSYFSGAVTQVAVALSRGLVAAGHTVTFLTPSTEKQWFIDCKEYESKVAPRVSYDLSTIVTPYDVLIEVVWHIPAQDRPKVATKTVLFAHYPPLFHDMESSVYQCNQTKRDFTNIHGVWTWDHYNEDDIRYLSFLSGVTVTQIPFAWDSCPLDIYEKESSLPSWSHSAKEIQSKIPAGAPASMAWCLRTVESNMSNSSSAILPVNIVSAIRQKGDEVRWMVHNGEGIIQSEFFKANILKNCNLGPDLSGSFVGRLRLPDLRRDKTVLLCHQRWRPLKATLLDALYLGIPMIHNCAIAKKMGGQYYYELNQIQDAQEAWVRLKTDAEAGTGFFHPTAISVRKRTLNDRFGPTSNHVQTGIQAAMAALACATPRAVSTSPTSSSVLKIAFVDFSVEPTLFVDLFRWAGTRHGFTVEVTKIDPSLLFYGPTGTEHQAAKWKSIPKIFYTNESLPQRTDYNTLLNLGFEYPKQGGTPYIRIPSWILDIDWFQKDSSKICVEDCQRAVPSTWDRFASFVCNTPSNPLRNTAFQLIQQYKPVESAGSFFCNRTGGQISSTTRAIVDYYKSSKFVIAFEDLSNPGYCSEVLLRAKVAGAIPIYWGDPLVTNDFDEAGFFHAGKCGNGEDLIKQLKALDEDEARCKAMQAVPALSEKKRKECQETLSVLVKAVAAIALRRDITINAAEWAEPAAPPAPPTPPAPAPAPPTPPVAIPPSLLIQELPSKKCLITAANAKYIDSVRMLLDSLSQVEKTPIPTIVYIWSDVPEEARNFGPTVTVRVMPTHEVPWEDFWNPQHFAWKLWVLQDAGSRLEAGTNLLYFDSGVCFASPITKIWDQINRQNVFLTNDDEQLNERWCHPEFCKALATTSAELKENQLWAGGCGYKVGSRYQSQLFDAAYQIAKTQPSTIIGHKWTPYGGACFGHRHDQSILSILSSRCHAPRVPLREFYCDHSLRRAQAWGTPLYVHRGQFKPFVPFTANIGEVYLINADSNPDRLQQFKSNHPALYKQTYKWRGTDAIALQLTPPFARLFQNNDFQWKKTTIARAIEHLGLWERAANDPHGQPYLILEDTVRLIPDWETAWKKESIPADTEVTFLAGAAAYILTQAGARAILSTIKHRGFFTDVTGLLALRTTYSTTALLANVTIATPTLMLENESEDPVITIAFSDMWPGFNYNSNFIMDTMRSVTKMQLHGVEYTPACAPALLIFGPYSESWKTIPASIPKVFFTAENWKTPTTDPSVVLSLTSSRTEDAAHIRLPTWMTFIDWFSGSTELPEQSTDNPIRFPVHFARTTPPYQERNNFCGFVVSNPICTLRNETFHAVNAYKRVNSGGALYNNIGGQLVLLYPGGGSGDVSKNHFFRQHKFTISFENSQAAGYITEKVLHSKMAGCIPIYWGDANTETDFAPNSFVNVSHLQHADQVLEALKTVEKDVDRCRQIATTPILDDASYAKAMQKLAQIGQALVSLCAPAQPAALSKTFVINLDTRRDRWAALMKAEPSLQSIVTRVPGVNGKTLTMSPTIYSLFEKNQFQWKKSIIGCNMSHIAVWSQITKSEGDYFLVLEDDVRFAPNWKAEWERYAKLIPEDADLLYLGGILPPNKPALPSVLESVNACWATVKPNTLFSSVPVPLFHFCAYSYILRKRGAQKLIDYLTISDTKSFTVSDHLLGHPSIGLKKYIATPLLTHCFQDDDPVYQNSQFNNLQRKDTFDSDIWNNTERFTEADLKPYQESFSADEIVSQLAVVMKPQVIATVAENSIGIYCIPGTGLEYEKQWLEDMFQMSLTTGAAVSPLPNKSLLLIQRTPPTFASKRYKQILDETAAAGHKVILVHISDENGRDPIDLYDHPAVKHVVRNYYRADCVGRSHVLTLPLGYSGKASTAAPTFAERSLRWSFAGSLDRPKRAEALRALEVLTPFDVKTKGTFGDPSPLQGAAYTDQLLRSQFIPAFRGFWSLESFRLYEALEAGCIPLYVPSEGEQGDEYTHVLGKSPILALPSWAQAPVLLEQLSKNSAVMEQHRQDLQTWWREKKQSLRTILSDLLK